MSLVSTWVQASDGLLYQDPVLEGSDWFLCFDDDDPPELVVVRSPGLDPRVRAVEILAKLGCEYEMISARPGSSWRCFGEDVVPTKPANAWFVKIKSRIPPPHRFEQKLTVQEFKRRVQHCVLYEWALREE